VKLINLDNLVLIGPGSEWFWTAFSAIVVAITFIAIYRQVRMQRSSAAIAQLDSIGREWASERMSKAYLEVLHAIEAGGSVSDYPPAAVGTVGDFWERVGYLTRMGHFDRKLVHWNLGLIVEFAWLRMRPVVLDARERAGTSLVWTDFEWLANAMSRLNARHGIALGATTSGDPIAMAAANRRTIRQLEEDLAAEAELRTVPVRVVEFSRAG
jgi:hypothetical protein